MVYRLISSNTIEDDSLKLLDPKRKLLKIPHGRVGQLTHIPTDRTV